MVDPTSDLGEDVDEETAPRCAACGAPVVDAPTHRVVTWVEDGTVRHRHFCDDDCRGRWMADG
jgi:hypothetical protein